MPLAATGLEWTKPELDSLNIVGLSNGTFLALWVVLEDGQGRQVRGQFLDPDGTAIGGPFVLASVGAGSLSSPVPIPLSNGRFAVAWNYNTDGLGAFEVQTATVRPTGEIERSITTIGQAAHDGMTTVLPNGGYVLGYRKFGEEVKDKLEYFGPDGVSIGTFDSAAVGSRAIAALSNGSLLSVATTSPGIGTAITAYLQRPGGEPTTIAIAEFDGLGGETQIVALANGNAVILWNEGNALNARIINPVGERIGGEIALYQAPSGSLEQMTVEALPEGGFAVAFVNRSTEQGVGTDIYVGIYSADGHVVEAPSVVGRVTAGSQDAPDIAVLKDGRYVVSWHDLQDGLTHFQAYDPRTKGVSVSGDEANDRLTGSRFDDAFNGGGGTDRLLGEGGNDILNGGLGGDLMFGGSGNDTYYVDSADDRIVEWANSGVDHVVTEVSQDLWDEVENLTASGTGALTLNGNELSNMITGNASQNVLSGKAGNDILSGGAGADQMIGGMGDDTLYVDDAGDQVVEAQGGGQDTVYTDVNFTLSASQEIETLAATGGAGVTLKGNHLANAVAGNSGANKLWGGLGNDQLTGGSGKDFFVFDTKAHKSKNKDRVADFKVADDTIWLDNKVFSKLGKKGTEKKPAKLDKGFFVVGSKAKDKNDYIVYDKKKGVLLYDADGSGKGKALEVATLSKNLKMTEKDFFVI